MSLTLLPAVDVRDGKAVRLRQGESGSETDYGSPLEAARTWVESGAEWIHLVDLDAAFGTGNNRDQLRAIVKELGSCPTSTSCPTTKRSPTQCSMCAKCTRTPCTRWRMT